MTKIENLCELIGIRASVLEELNANEIDRILHSFHHNEYAKILNEWKEQACAGNRILFDAMLQERRRNRKLNLLSTGKTDPRWKRQLQWILEALRVSRTSLMANTESSKFPFFQIYEPLINAATAKLSNRINTRRPQPNWLSPEALEQLRGDLRNRLSEVCAPVLYEAFLLSKLNAKKNCQYDAYEKFILDFPQIHLETLVSKYPVLFRLVSTLCDQWIVTNAEFLKRFCRDYPLIVARFSFDSVSLPVISSIDSNLGDPHRSGRSVKVVHLGNGVRVLYKPRSLTVDDAWEKLIVFLNENSSPYKLRIPKVLDRGQYGWAEFIPHMPCEKASDFESFYERIGAWLFLFYLLSATDIHEENIIACGSEPIPVDLELTLQQHESLRKDVFGPYFLGTSMELAERSVSDTVLATGLLPTYGQNLDNSVYFTSGLAVGKYVDEKVGWKEVNCSGMTAFTEQQESEVLNNVPYTQNEIGSYEKHSNAILRGFERYSNFILQIKGEKPFADQVSRFSNCCVRTLMKPTRFYSHLLKRVVDFRALGDGITWGLSLRFPDRFVAWDDSDGSRLAAVADHEYRELLSMSVPSFSCNADATDLKCGREQIQGLFEEDGFSCAQRRIYELSLEQIERQADFVGMVLGRHTDSEMPLPTDSTLIALNASPTPLDLGSSAADFEDLPDQIFLHLSKRVLRKGKTATWVGFDWLGDTAIPQLAPLGADLYNGNGGIALFLAAYSIDRKHDEALTLCYESVASMRRIIRSNHSEMYARKVGLGIGAGVGSMIYSLAALSEILGDSSLLEDAVEFSSVINHRLLASDSGFDLISGTAGSIVALLKTYSLTGERTLLEKARLCADRLIERASPNGQLENLWVPAGMGNNPLTGMSHGASGFAFAFGLLFNITDDPQYRNARDFCLDFEDSVFDKSRGAWPDLREVATETEVTWPSQWCHGATGIGLSRLALLKADASSDPRILHDLEYAIARTLEAWPYPVDTVCCGSAGNAWFLYEAGQKFGRKALEEAAIERFATLYREAKPKLAFRWTTLGAQEYNLGFFRGVAGMGYAALRLSGRSLPNVLTLA
jgi:type 2 lantibiotic biosynthesis protein LanM